MRALRAQTKEGSPLAFQIGKVFLWFFLLLREAVAAPVLELLDGAWSNLEECKLSLPWQGMGLDGLSNFAEIAGVC